MAQGDGRAVATDHDGPATGGKEVLLFVVALSLLAFEMAQIRAFSYSMDPRLVYGAIGLAMLGMGASAVVAALRPSWLAPRLLSVYLAAFGLSALLAMAFFARRSSAFDASSLLRFVVTGAPLFLACAVPYAFAGLAIVTLQSEGEAMHRRYVANLLGSSVGCFAIQPLLPLIGLERLLFLVAALPVLAAAIASRRAILAAISVGLLIASFVPRVAEWTFPFQPDPLDLYALGERAAVSQHLEPLPGAPPGKVARRDLAVWDPIARVEVLAFPGELGLLNGRAPLALLLHDGGAGSLLFGSLGDHPDLARGLFEGTTYVAAYSVFGRPDSVLAIGLGGGPDIMAAKHHGVRRIVGVEVNGATLQAIRSRFSGFLGDPYRGVELHHLDGRSFVESTHGPFDVVQISGTDTYSAGNAGAFMFSESYLYTEEAIEAYLRVLSPNGVLAMIRFGPEPLRLVVTEVEAARKLGIAHPERHFVVLGQGFCQAVVFARQPITHEQLVRVASTLATARGLPTISAPLNSALGFGPPDLPPLSLVYAPGVPGSDPIVAYLRSVSTGTDREWLATLPFDFSPARDDRPFFFQFLGPRQIGRVFSAPPDDFFARGLRGHLSMLLALVVLTSLVLFAPLASSRAMRRSLSSEGRGVGAPLAFFGAIGLGFLLVELALIQRTALLLGHPTWSVSTTLCVLLASSALGSALARRRSDQSLPFVALGLAAALLLVAFVPGTMVAALLRLPFVLRILVLAIVIAPLGIAMGAFFPTGLRAVSRRGTPLVAWAQGVNAFASVVASLTAPVLAMLFGFRVVLLIALGAYGVAALASYRLHEGREAPRGDGA